MKCFYHNDLDGECSAAIVNHHYGSECEFIEMNYDRKFPIDEIKKDELIWIVDFSLQKPEEFDALLKITDNVIWVDHHKTSIEKHPDKVNVTGVRGEGGVDQPAACELVWNWIFPGINPPEAVLFVSDYDSWTYKFKETKAFKLGLDVENTNPKSEIWEMLFDGGLKPYDIALHGDVINRYRDKFYAGLIRGNSFRTKFEGLSGVACNAGPGINSDLFQTAGELDIMLPYYFNGRTFTVSIYTTKEHIDCSEIAKKYGGGGHKQAAGFQCTELPFKCE